MAAQKSLPAKLPLEMLQHWAKVAPSRLCLRQFVGDAERDYSFSEVLPQVQKVARFLIEKKLPPQSHIALIGKNSAQWVMVDWAIWLSGHVSVPIYPNLSAAHVVDIVKHSDSSVIFVGKLDKGEAIVSALPAELLQLAFDAPLSLSKGQSWEDILSATALPSEAAQFFPQRTADELATLIYTSGTSGVPKGVMHSFASISFAGEQMVAELGIGTSDRLFSYLPLAHTAERLIVEMAGLYGGCAIAFVESLDAFANNLSRWQPTMFLAVPRIWAKMQSNVLRQFKKGQLEKLLAIPLLGRFIARQIKKKMGLAHAHTLLTGAAPMSQALLQWFKKMGFNIQNAYGMTENFAYSHYARRSETGEGLSIGRANPNVENRIDPATRELLVRSASSMMGYYKDPEQSQQAFNDEGYLHTGDQAVICDNGEVQLTGRIKELFKTSKGKYVAPSPIEAKLMTKDFVEQVCVLGEGLSQPLALVVIHGRKAGEGPCAELESELKALIQSTNSELDSHERLSKAVVLSEPWTQENGLLTPTLKVRRSALEKMFEKEIPNWADDRSQVLWSRP